MIFVIVGPVYVTYRDDASAESGAKSNYLYVGPDGETALGCPDFPGNESYIYLEVNVLSLTAAQSTVKMVVDMYPVNGLAQANSRIGELNLKGNATLVMYVSKTKFTFKDGASMGKSTVEEILTPACKYCSSTFYPMDR